MKQIPLTRGLFALVDDADYESLAHHKWYAHWDPHTRSFRATRQERRGDKQATVLMSRVITGAEVGQVVDHRNHDTLDERRCNLRVCTARENGYNKRRARGSSKYKGVHWKSTSWEARIGQTHLGRFADETEAARAYDNAARRQFGEFALCNFNNA